MIDANLLRRRAFALLNELDYGRLSLSEWNTKIVEQHMGALVDDHAKRLIDLAGQSVSGSELFQIYLALLGSPALTAAPGFTAVAESAREAYKAFIAVSSLS